MKLSESFEYGYNKSNIKYSVLKICYFYVSWQYEKCLKWIFLPNLRDEESVSFYLHSSPEVQSEQFQNICGNNLNKFL